MDDETLIKKLRKDSGLPPQAPEDEWQSLQTRLGGLKMRERRPWRDAVWVSAGLALAGAALVLWLPKGGTIKQAEPLSSEDSAEVLEQLIAKEQQQLRPQVADLGTPWLALMDSVQD